MVVSILDWTLNLQYEKLNKEAKSAYAHLLRRKKAQQRAQRISRFEYPISQQEQETIELPEEETSFSNDPSFAGEEVKRTSSTNSDDNNETTNEERIKEGQDEMDTKGENNTIEVDKDLSDADWCLAESDALISCSPKAEPINDGDYVAVDEELPKEFMNILSSPDLSVVPAAH